jgi:hypothetical protein
MTVYCPGKRLGFEDHTVCSDPFRKFTILLDPSTTSQICVLTCSDWIGRVLSIELSRFYHGKSALHRVLLSSLKGIKSGLSSEELESLLSLDIDVRAEARQGLRMDSQVFEGYLKNRYEVEIGWYEARQATQQAAVWHLPGFTHYSCRGYTRPHRARIHGIRRLA